MKRDKRPDPEVLVLRRPVRSQAADSRIERTRSAGLYVGDEREAAVSRDDLVRE